MPEYTAPQASTSSATPYLVPSAAGVGFTAIVTAGDSIGTRADGSDSLFAGKPDGIGAFDNGDGTISVLVNHELGRTQGVVREHGSAGAFVDLLTIDKATLSVIRSEDLVKQVALYDDATDQYVLGTTAFGNLCSGDLAEPGAFYDAASGLGTQSRIYLSGEEAGTEGRAFAFVATGSEAGIAYELPWMGRLSFENTLAAPGAGARTVVIGTNDATPGQLYLYAGDKQASGTDIDKAGLTNGLLYGIRVEGMPLDGTAGPGPGGQGTFTLAPLGDVSEKSGATLQTESVDAAVTEFCRPEDGAWDPSNPNAFYFATTGTSSGPSRLYRLDFYDVARPELGGEITALLNGSEGHRGLDNIDVTDEGLVILQEDPGNGPGLARVWQYDPFNDVLTKLAEHDPARFGEPQPPFTQNEESSGVVDVSALLATGGEKVFLLDVQAHYSVSDPRVVEGGQLLAMSIAPDALPAPDGDGRFAVDDAAVVEADAGGSSQIVFTVRRSEGSTGAASVDYRVAFLAGGAGAGDLAQGTALTGTLIFAEGETSRTVTLTVAGDGVAEGDEVLGLVLTNATGANGIADPVALGTIVDDDGVSLAGGEGDDVLTGTARDDTLTGNGGDDRLDGAAGEDVLEGGTGADMLDGGAGTDRLTGGDGDDLYVIDDARDKIVEGSATGGNDTVYASVSYSLAGRYVESLVLTGNAAIGGTGNGLPNRITGNSAANLIDGAGGADTMRGGAGDDTYLVENIGDKVVEAAGGGNDTVRSSVSFSLAGQHVETLLLTGADGISGTGNSLANRLVGNGAANVLNGGEGADWMSGGGGSDTYYVENAGDLVFEQAGGGHDIVRSSVGFSLAGQDIEDLVLTGGNAIDGTGNALANGISGNSAANRIDGGAGADRMSGGAGNDSYVVDNAGDLVFEANGGGTDIVLSSVGFSLAGQYIEELTLTGSGASDGTGNSLSNVLRGNGAVNSLSAREGDDHLFGGNGNDRLTGGAGQDAFHFDTALSATGNVDRILDFSAADDTIMLDRSVFGAVGTDGTLDASAFVAGTAAADADDRIVYDAGSGRIYYDADGSGAGTAVLFASVASGTQLSHLDFSAYTLGA
ncbi:MAG TPA: hypothetical protein VF727_17135 [Allosphingosinicella sp.]